MAELYKIFDITHNLAAPLAEPDIVQYEIYYDKDEEDGVSSDFFVVHKDSVLITSDATEISVSGGPATNITSYNIQFTQNGLTTYFEPDKYFPYAKRLTTTIITPGVNDMTLSLTVRNATGYTADGGILPTVTGTNSPFQVKLGTETYTDYAAAITQYNTSIPVFGALYPGVYSVTSIDNSGYTRTVSAQIFTEAQVGAATYGILLDFTWISLGGSDLKIEILERDYAGSTTTLTDVGPNPFIFSLNAESKDPEDIQIRSSSATVELLSTTFREWTDFINGDDEKYKIKFYLKNGAAWDYKWQGFILPENIQEDLYFPPYVVSVVATDRLADLSNFSLDPTFVLGEFTVNLDFPDETVQLIQIIQDCLSKINMSQGYRIANNLYEVSQDDAASTPFHQTYVNKASYKGMNCKEILEHVLKPFGAVISSWEGYWYIERMSQKISTSITYKEYDSSLNYVTTDSYNQRTTFKTSTESNKWRWMGSQRQGYTSQYNKVNIDLQLNKKAGGITNGLQEAEWSQIDEGVLMRYFNWKSQAVSIGIGRGTSDTYIQKTGTLEHSISDSINLKFTVNCRMVDQSDNIIVVGKDLAFRGPYFPLKWQLKVGSSYMDAEGAWTTTETINQLFIETLDTDHKLEINRRLFGSLTSSAYDLKIWGGSVFDYDEQYVNRATMKSTIKGITTLNTLTPGIRKIANVLGNAGDLEFYYYQLQKTDSTSDNISILEPNDWDINTNPLKWVLLGQWDYDHGPYGGDGLYGALTETTISNFDLEILPNGLEPPDEEKITVLSSENNKRSLSTSLYNFDLTGNITGDQDIYNNFLRNADGTATVLWSDGGPNKKIQNHLIEWLNGLYRRPRVKVSGSFMSDEFITPMLMLYSPSDDGKIFWMTGVSFDYTKGQYSGEVVEISSDSFPDVSDWDKTDFLATDFY